MKKLVLSVAILIGATLLLSQDNKPKDKNKDPLITKEDPRTDEPYLLALE